MYVTMLKSKIHRATVTQADLHYVGSLTLDEDLMAKAGLLPGEKVDIVDINNGNRLSTYLIKGPRNSGVVGINGAAARLIGVGDLVIIIAYRHVPEATATEGTPRVVFVDEHNRVTSLGQDPAEPGELPGTLRGDVTHPVV
ncbi:aspartate 1-decarboxylase [Streptomyces sp. HNM0663]|uniref:Aspartate 1-decarboxylase n=1 Tax=Streptomyces chengmaiensis TaxID=3040919 RepID=A0ABT6HPC9_9ACTN|nr:aspartate 1-decarboxylase [Streptomyces chengmaiensis]MDH2390585.1 aspartate 1-decarboxylase [Streptomyces chengmaiensis]